MWPISSTFRAAIRESHTVAVQIDILRQGELLASITTSAVDGSVTCERGGIQRRASLSFVDEDETLTPKDAADLLLPLGNDIRIFRGIQYPDHTTDMVPIFTGVMTQSSAQYPNITVEAYDFGYRIQQRHLLNPYTITKGSNRITAIQDLLTNMLPQLDFNFTADPVRTTAVGVTYREEMDMMQELQQLAENAGLRLWCDQMGMVRLDEEPQYQLEEVVWEYVDDDSTSGNLVQCSRNWDAEDVFNQVTVTNEGAADDTITLGRATAFDLDPDSPTYWHGPFGPRSHYMTSPDTPVGELQTVANAVLRKQLGLTEAISFTGLVNPAHEVGDVILIRRPALGIDAVHILDRFTIPLRGNTAMEATTRLRTAVAL